MDNYLSLFFIPVVRVKKGGELWQCSRCGATYQGAPPDIANQRTEGRCPGCGSMVEPGFKFCPHCGRAQ